MTKLRELYNVAHIDAQNCNCLIENAQHDSAVVSQGYLAAGIIISAKFLFNPLTKIKLFNDGKKRLEDLIAQNPRAYELFYIRYSIQKNTPSFLGYNRNLNTDRMILVNFFENSNDQILKDHILFYLQNTDDLWPELTKS
ncbi:MAG: hypothetical protein R2780_11815 [Crocinitomicaceae bacterium]